MGIESDEESDEEADVVTESGFGSVIGVLTCCGNSCCPARAV